MKIGGLLRSTLLDFPGRVSALVFARGCNFCCPYCHNPALLLPEGEQVDTLEVLTFLEGRRRVLEGVVVSGGEPTLQSGLPAFCRSLKDMGYAVKIDSNGSRPKVLRTLLEDGLVDYVAVDMKADPLAYPETLAPPGAGDALLRTIALLGESGVAHEFRTTCVEPFITPESFAAILGALKGQAPLFLQKARLAGVADPTFAGLRELPASSLEELRQTALRRGQPCEIR